MLLITITSGSIYIPIRLYSRCFCSEMIRKAREPIARLDITPLWLVSTSQHVKLPAVTSQPVFSAFFVSLTAVARRPHPPPHVTRPRGSVTERPAAARGAVDTGWRPIQTTLVNQLLPSIDVLFRLTA